MVKKKKKDYLTNGLIIFLIVCVLGLLVFSIANLNNEDSNYINENESLKEGEGTADDFNITVTPISQDDLPDISPENINITVSPIYSDDEDFNLNDLEIPESNLLEEHYVTLENYDFLKNVYGFLFDQSIIESFGYEMTEIGDFILEFEDYILVYDFENENVKSFWVIGISG